MAKACRRKMRLRVSAATPPASSTSPMICFRSRLWVSAARRLPSIASVSRLNLETQADGSIGTAIEIAGGKILSQREQAFPRGTQITVEDLVLQRSGAPKVSPIRIVRTEPDHDILHALRSGISGDPFPVEERRIRDHCRAGDRLVSANVFSRFSARIFWTSWWNTRRITAGPE